MARPRLPDSKRRCHRIAVRLSFQDLEKLEAQRAEAQSVAAHLRSAALSRPRPEPMPQVNRIVLNLLRELGQRLNEQVRAGHRGQPVAITGSDLKDIRNLLLYLLRDLKADR